LILNNCTPFNKIKNSHTQFVWLIYILGSFSYKITILIVITEWLGLALIIFIYLSSLVYLNCLVSIDRQSWLTPFSEVIGRLLTWNSSHTNNRSTNSARINQEVLFMTSSIARQSYWIFLLVSLCNAKNTLIKPYINLLIMTLFYMYLCIFFNGVILSLSKIKATLSSSSSSTVMKLIPS